MSLFRVIARLSLFWQLLIPSAAAIIISVVAVQAWTLNISQTALEHRMRRDLDSSMGLLKSYLRPLGTDWSREGGLLRLGTTGLAGMDSVVDNAAAASGGVATIFSGDERIATNVLRRMAAARSAPN